MTQAVYILLVAAIETIVVWAILFTIIFIVLLNAGVLPRPSEDEWMSRFLLASLLRRRFRGGYFYVPSTAVATFIILRSGTDTLTRAAVLSAAVTLVSVFQAGGVISPGYQILQVDSPNVTSPHQRQAGNAATVEILTEIAA